MEMRSQGMDFVNPPNWFLRWMQADGGMAAAPEMIGQPDSAQPGLLAGPRGSRDCQVGVAVAPQPPLPQGPRSTAPA